MPIWSNSLLVDHVRPAAVLAGVDKHIRWRSFRSSLATQLNANGENVKTTQKTLGHARSAITTDVYLRAVDQDVREAHNRIMGGLLPNGWDRLASAGVSQDLIGLSASADSTPEAHIGPRCAERRVRPSVTC